MRFQIRRALGGAAGLRVIPEIPNIDPCLIEGPNGIGKTLAVRLLQLVAGDQPYLTDQQLWDSLREGLGPTTVTVEGLRGQRTLRVELNPSQWPADVTQPARSDLGEAWLDEQPFDVRRCPELLSVVRIAGTETPDETVRRSMSVTQARLKAAAATVGPRLAEVRAAAAPLQATLRDVDPERAAILREERGQLRQQAEVSEHAAQTAAARLELTIAALHARSALAAREAGAQEKRERLAVVEQELKAARSRQTELETAADVARQELVRSGIIAERQAAAEQTLQRQLTRLANRAEEAEAALRAAGNPGDLAGEISSVATELANVRAERADLDTDERVERLVTELRAAVDLARREGVGDEKQVLQVNGKAIGAAELAAALQQRANELAGRPTPDELTRLDKQIEALVARRNRLLTAKERVEARDGQKQRVDEQRAEVQRLRSQGSPDVQERLQTLLTDLGAANEQVLTLAREAVALRAEMTEQDFASAADAQRMLDQSLATLDVAPDQLEAEAVQVRSAHEAAQAQLATDRQALRRVEHELRVAALAAERSATVLQEQPELLAALNGAGATAVDGRFAERIAIAVRAVDQRLTDTTNTVAALAEAAGSLARGEQLRGRLFVESFTQTIGERLRRDLDTPAIREALFDAQPLHRLDLGRQVLVWTSADGEPRERPLRAFSTGEQAFAFTQARIRELEPVNQSDRLLVLDEFGAFVSADRMHALAEFLHADEVQRLASQVLVILPQQVNYAAELGETRGDLRRRYEERVAQLDRQGYIALPLAEAV